MKLLSSFPSSTGDLTTRIAMYAMIGQTARVIAIACFILGIVGILAHLPSLAWGGFVTCGVAVVVMIGIAIAAYVTVAGQLREMLKD